jgi:hypothetical protein
MLFGARVPDEVALTVLSHLDDPRDLLRVAETCRRALRLARGSPPNPLRPLWANCSAAGRGGGKSRQAAVGGGAAALTP